MFSDETEGKLVITEKERTVAVSTRISNGMFQELKSFLPTSSHINIADYIRDLIRTDLKSQEANRAIRNDSKKSIEQTR